MRYLALLFLSSCATFLNPIPGMVAIGNCKKGPAYSYKQELICDHVDMPFVSRPLEPNETEGSACKFCDGFLP